MGKLIKNHWARLIVLTAAACKIRLQPNDGMATDTNADHVAATIESFFWPKFFFDFLTKNFDLAVKPIPILQTINLVLALVTLAYEWPLKHLAGTRLHTSIEARLVWLPLVSLSAVLLYQATNAALYYAIAVGVYFLAYAEGEVICAVPWTLPKRADRKVRSRAEKV